MWRGVGRDVCVSRVRNCPEGAHSSPEHHWRYVNHLDKARGHNGRSPPLPPRSPADGPPTAVDADAGTLAFSSDVSSSHEDTP